MRLRVTYDPEVGAAYILIGGPRRVSRTVELDEDTWADYDSEDQVIGIEFLSVSEPEVVILHPGQGVTKPPRITTVKTTGEVL